MVLGEFLETRIITATRKAVEKGMMEFSWRRNVFQRKGEPLHLHSGL